MSSSLQSGIVAGLRAHGVELIHGYSVEHTDVVVPIWMGGEAPVAVFFIEREVAAARAIDPIYLFGVRERSTAARATVYVVCGDGTGPAKHLVAKLRAEQLFADVRILSAADARTIVSTLLSSHELPRTSSVQLAASVTHELTELAARFAPVVSASRHRVFQQELSAVVHEFTHGHYTACTLRVGRALEYIVYSCCAAWGVHVAHDANDRVESTYKLLKKVERRFGADALIRSIFAEARPDQLLGPLLTARNRAAHAHVGGLGQESTRDAVEAMLRGVVSFMEVMEAIGHRVYRLRQPTWARVQHQTNAALSAVVGWERLLGSFLVVIDGQARKFETFDATCTDHHSENAASVILERLVEAGFLPSADVAKANESLLNDALFEVPVPALPALAAARALAVPVLEFDGATICSNCYQSCEDWGWVAHAFVCSRCGEEACECRRCVGLRFRRSRGAVGTLQSLCAGCGFKTDE